MREKRAFQSRGYISRQIEDVRNPLRRLVGQCARPFFMGQLGGHQLDKTGCTMDRIFEFGSGVMSHGPV